MEIKEAVIICIGRGLVTIDAMFERMPKRGLNAITKTVARLKLQGQIVDTAGGYALTTQGEAWFKRLVVNP